MEQASEAHTADATTDAQPALDDEASNMAGMRKALQAHMWPADECYTWRAQHTAYS